LIMFQVWFSRSNSVETLHSYNQRLGRPRHGVRHGIVPKTKAIMNCSSWNDYFHELRVDVGGRMEIDQLLRFAVWNSSKKRYHIGSDAMIKKVDRPNIEAIVESIKGTFVSTNALVIKRSNRGNVWNSDNGESAVTMLFGRSCSRNVPRSKRTVKAVKSTMKSTEQSSRREQVAAKMTTKPLTKGTKQSATNQKPPKSRTSSDSKRISNGKPLRPSLSTQTVATGKVVESTENIQTPEIRKIETPIVSSTETVDDSVQSIQRNQDQNPQSMKPQKASIPESELNSKVNHIEPQHKQRIPERRPFELRATAAEWNGYGHCFYPQNNGLWISTPIHKPVPVGRDSVPHHGWNGGSYPMMNTPSIWSVNASNMDSKPYSGDIWSDFKSVVNEEASISSRSAFSAETPNEDIL